MPDNQSTIILNAEDRTAAAFKSATANAERYSKTMGGVLSGGRQSVSPQEMQRRLEIFKRQTEEQVRQNRAQQEGARVTRDTTSALAGMAARYLTVGYALNKVREGFVDFAADQERFRVAGARMGATNDQLEQMRKTVEQIGNTFGKSVDEVVRTTEAFREAAYLTKNELNDILRIAPGIAEVSRRFGVDSTEMAQAFGSFVHQLQIAPAQWEKALGAMGAVAKDLNLDFGQLNRYAPQISEAMAGMGVKGVEGLNQVLAVLATTREQFGSTTLAARALTQYLNEIQRGGGVASALGMDQAEWSATMDNAVAQGRNFFDFYLGKIREARQLGYEWGELFEDPRQRRFWKELIENSGHYRDIIAKLSKESGDFHAGNIKDLENTALAMDRLLVSWQNMWKGIAEAAEAAGFSELMNKITTDMAKITNVIKSLEPLLRGEWSWKNVNAAGQAAGSLFSDSATFGERFGTWPARAGGGPVSAGSSYLVGERGPELFTPGSGGNIQNDNAVKRGLRNALNAYETFVKWMNATPLGPGQKPTALSNFRSAIHPEFETVLDQMLSWGFPRSGVGSVLRGLSAARMAGGEVVPLADPLHLAKSQMRYFGGENTPEETAYWNNTSMARMARGDVGGPTETLKAVARDTEDSNVILTQIRDLLQRQQDEEVGGYPGGGRSTGGGGGMPEGYTGYGAGGGVRSRGGGGGGGANYEGDYEGPISGTLAEQRAGFMKELNDDPALKDFAIDAMNAEGGLQSNFEQLFNYASMRHMTIRQALHSGQYGPVNRLAVSGRIGSDLRARGERALGRVGAGSNITDYATDQGMITDPNGAKYAANPEYYNRKIVEGGIFSYHGRLGRSWAMKQRALEAARAGTATVRPTQPMPPVQGFDDVQQLRSELSQPITIRTQLDKGSDSQFRRASIRREVNREVREAAWQSYNDIGSA